MLDHLSLRLAKPLLNTVALQLKTYGIKADQITIFGFIVGIAGALAIAFHFFLTALTLIVINRLADGIDGTLARQSSPTDSGAYLDICLDFIFYSAIVFGFALADPTDNGLAAGALIFSFVGTGSSFLAFAIMAERRNISDLRLPSKGFYYLGGLTEGTETFIFFCLFCLFPHLFPLLAWIFATLCIITTLLRIIYGYRTLKD